MKLVELDADAAAADVVVVDSRRRRRVSQPQLTWAHTVKKSSQICLILAPFGPVELLLDSNIGSASYNQHGHTALHLRSATRTSGLASKSDFVSNLYILECFQDYMSDEFSRESSNDDSMEDDDDMTDDDYDRSNHLGSKMAQFTEMKEQMYQDKLADLKRQLALLQDGTLPEFQKRLKR